MFETEYELFLGKKFLIESKDKAPTSYPLIELGADQRFASFLPILENFIKSGFIDIGYYKYGKIHTKPSIDIRKKFPVAYDENHTPYRESPPERISALENELEKFNKNDDEYDKKMKDLVGATKFDEFYQDYCLIYEKQDYFFNPMYMLTYDNFNGLDFKITVTNSIGLTKAIDEKTENFINGSWPSKPKPKNNFGYDSLKEELLTNLSALYKKFRNKTIVYEFSLDDYGFYPKAEITNSFRTLLGIEKEGFFKIKELAPTQKSVPTNFYSTIQLSPKFFEDSVSTNTLSTTPIASFDPVKSLITCNTAPGKSYPVQKNKAGFYLCKKMFKSKPGFTRSWDKLDKDNLTKEKQISDAAEHINKRLKKALDLEENLFTFQNHSITRNF